MMRQLQPDLPVNNRLGTDALDNEEAAGGSKTLGDFETPEHHITAQTGRLWESCQVSTWRLWGWATGERWRSAPFLLDMLIDATQKGVVAPSELLV